MDKLKENKQVILYLITLLFLITFLKMSLSQPESVEQAFEKAMKNIETERERKRQELISSLKMKLNLATEEWISLAKKNKNSDLNKLLQQNWEKLSKTLNISPVHYDYYLRGYDYSVTKSDILETDSLAAPYKAYINIVEKLYVSKYHSPDASDVSQFLYTVTTPITISLEYNEDKFIVTNTEYGKISLEKDWPDEEKRKIILR